MQTGLRNGQQPREVIDALKDQAASADARLLVIANNRRVLVDSENSLANQTLPPPTQGTFGQFIDGSDQWLFVQQAFRPAAAGPNPAIIVVARPRAAFGDALRALLPSLLVAGVVAAGFALIVAGLLSRTITRPLRELVAGARRFARGEYRTRVPVAFPASDRPRTPAARSLATARTTPTTAVAVGAPPAPRPLKTIRPTSAPSTSTALKQTRSAMNVFASCFRRCSRNVFT